MHPQLRNPKKRIADRSIRKYGFLKLTFFGIAREGKLKTGKDSFFPFWRIFLCVRSEITMSKILLSFLAVFNSDLIMILFLFIKKKSENCFKNFIFSFFTQPILILPILIGVKFDKLYLLKRLAIVRIFKARNCKVIIFDSFGLY